ncbi:PIN domain-like protein [Kockovaella imperatae]|uniref:PIN domain-like protein n=1 Tax=Kockovaella imperatae TaxID=4999 RepID=A0A1Y1UNF6_9TREE|nr:PIN domain-like protein [Kockovaella imperatae]ORX39598.1 PIN domain-like protein [Kockovaella imperatae]
MGIQGLLPMLKEIQESGHIEHFRGKRLAVDAYVWLHKGAFGCAEALVKGQVNTKFVDYAMHRVRLLRHYGIEPYIVFDGGPLPAKKVTEVARAKSRAESLAKARSLESQGRGHQARDHYTKCLDITPELAFQLIKALRAEEVDYIVAPYEADAQLCYLEREGIVDGIITEDSDLLVFGCKQVIFKLDGQGHCVWINRERFGETSSFPMHGWTDVEFRRMTMLSGCDYLPSIQGMGLKTAHRMLRRCKTVEKTLATVRMEGSMDIPSTYLAQFAQAELAFMYQRVYCPRAQRIITLNELPEVGISEDDHKWIGL